MRKAHTKQPQKQDREKSALKATAFLSPPPHLRQSELCECCSPTHSMPPCGTGSGSPMTRKKAHPKDTEVTQSWGRASTEVAVTTTGAYSSGVSEAHLQ